MEEGQGVVLLPSLLQEPSPAWLCMRPVFTTPLSVDWTRTQPLLSCIITARMNRASTPVSLAIDLMLVLMSLVSSSELSHDAAIRIWLRPQLEEEEKNV